MLKPNAERVIVKTIKNQALQKSGIIMPGQLKTGENLLIGLVEDGGDTKFTKGQIVYYSEYSASMVADVGKVFKNEISFSQATNEDNMFIVVAADDIMAFDDEDIKVPEEKDVKTGKII